MGRPFRAWVLVGLHSQGVALGWYGLALWAWLRGGDLVDVVGAFKPDLLGANLTFKLQLLTNPFLSISIYGHAIE